MKHTRTQLKNGLRIITIPIESTQTVTVMVLVEAGSKYENKKNNGISHFLEHMCFKGTKKRTVFQITEELDGLGAESNAFTSEEFTGYYAKAHYKHASKLIDIVSDIYLHSTLPAGEINKERGVIIEEINMYEDMPQRTVGEVFDRLLYGDQPAGMTVLGPRENIQKMSQAVFLRYRKEHYVAAGTAVVVAGNITPTIIREIQKAFAPISTTVKKGKKKTKDIQVSPQVALKYKKTDQAHLIIGCRSFDRYDKRMPALRVLATILGQGMSSRLFKIMRDERGMCYYVRAAAAGYTDTGVFAISVGVNKDRLEEAVEVILVEMKKVRDHGVLVQELDKAKEFIVGNQALGLESSSDYAEWFGFQELYHEKLRDLTAVATEVKKVTPQDVQDVARTVFYDARLNLALIGPFRNEKALQKKLTLQ